MWIQQVDRLFHPLKKFSNFAVTTPIYPYSKINYQKLYLTIQK